MEIKNLEDLIKSSLKDGQKMLSYECKKLLSNGENYGSVILQVQIKLANENGQEEIIQCVAKTCPPIGILWEAFNIKVTFITEISTYNTMVPTLNNFGREKGIDCLLDFLPKCIAARISLDPNSREVDENAVLVLENLKVSGYNIGDRFVGFDFDSAKLVLRDLATLHASVIAFRLANPSEFKEKFLPHLKGIAFVPSEEEVRGLIDVMVETVALNHKCVPHLSKIRQLIEQINLRRTKGANPPDINEAFATLIHNDFWLNNTMLKYENGIPIKNKIVDFQNIEFNTLGHDVIFFMYTSIAIEVLAKHADELFKAYYQKFIKTITGLKCNIAPYTFEAMMKEFATATKNGAFAHVMFMLFPIMMNKDSAKDVADMTGGDFVKDRRSFHDNFCNRMQFVLIDFINRGWI